MLPAGFTATLSGQGSASDYAASLLESLGAGLERQPGGDDAHPAARWADSGLMALSGHADGPPLLCPAPLAACADGALRALQALAPAGALGTLRGAELLAERAALLGLQRAGRSSPGGACRLLAAADGEFALSLARPEDWALLPALFASDACGDWAQVAAHARSAPLAELRERAHLLGLALAPVQPLAQQPAPRWFTAVQHAAPARRPAPSARARPVVLDLSALWAGPLCSHLLHTLGARVIKVESLSRPDGARAGNAGFYRLLNAGKQSVALDFSSAAGRADLRALVARADIVIEASRPRALRQMGIVTEDLLAAHPGLTWLALSGYGRAPEDEQRIAYGDDAGVAAGLSALMQAVHGQALFVGDAIADPLAGMHAALAAWASWLGGGGRLVAVALCEVVRNLIHFQAPADEAGWRGRQRDWLPHCGTVQTPLARAPLGLAAAPGADTARVLAERGD